MTAEEMRQAIITKILNRIDELDARLNDIESKDWYLWMARRSEAKYIIATCLKGED